mgnify:CR=1 FL=1
MNRNFQLPYLSLTQGDLIELSKKFGSDLRPLFTSRKIIGDIKVVEAKPLLIN